MAMLRVEVVTPEKRVWSGEAKMVTARTLDGELGVLPDHAPLLGVLADGTVSVKAADGPMISSSMAASSLWPTTAYQFWAKALINSLRISIKAMFSFNNSYSF
jgi:hypothetical protein